MKTLKISQACLIWIMNHFITLAFLFSITNNLALNFEFTHTEIDVFYEDLDADEFYVEGLFTF